MAKTKVFGYSGGTFSEKELAKARQERIPLTLDLAVPCSCFNNCIFCGYRFTQEGKRLSTAEILRIVDEFKELGGKSIKIVGEGEPLLRDDILKILKYIHSIGLKPVLFTCGDVLGDGELVKSIHGINSTRFINKLKKFDITVMLKYEMENEDQIVGREGFSELRNKALKLLIKAGLNKPRPTNLGFGIVVLKENAKEIPLAYEMALERNIYPLLCPLMPVGKVKEKAYREKLMLDSKRLVSLTVKLHSIAGKKGVCLEEVADFPGGLPCDIARAGFFIGSTGNIYLCESEENIGNIRNMALKEAWAKILDFKNRKYAGCRWDGKCFEKRRLGIIPNNFELKVKQKLEAH